MKLSALSLYGFSLTVLLAGGSASAQEAPRPILLERSLEACTNGIDDDTDGFRDCFDQDCQMYAVCAETARRSTPSTAPRTKPLAALLGTGAVSWGLSHLASIATSAIISDADPTVIGLGSIPLAGPWVLLGAVEGADEYMDSLIPLGVTQLSGFILTMVGAGVRVPVKDAANFASGISFGPSGVTYSLEF